MHGFANITYLAIDWPECASINQVDSAPFAGLSHDISEIFYRFGTLGWPNLSRFISFGVDLGLRKRSVRRARGRGKSCEAELFG